MRRDKLAKDMRGIFFVRFFFFADPETALLFFLPVLFGVFSFLLGKFVQHLNFGKYLNRLNGYLESFQ